MIENVSIKIKSKPVKKCVESKNQSAQHQAIKDISVDAMAKICDMMFHSPVGDLARYANDPSTDSVERLFLQVVLKVIENPDPLTIELFLNRFMGEPCEQDDEPEFTESQAILARIAWFQEAAAATDNPILKASYLTIIDFEGLALKGVT